MLHKEKVLPNKQTKLLQEEYLGIIRSLILCSQVFLGWAAWGGGLQCCQL